MSVLRLKKHGGGVGKIARSDISDSAARRDTKLERTPQQLRGIRDNDAVPGAAADDHADESQQLAASKNPKLQKKFLSSISHSSTMPATEDRADGNDSAPAAAKAGGTASGSQGLGDVGRPIQPPPPSGSLGTRSLGSSGGAGASSMPPQPGFSLQSRAATGASAAAAMGLESLSPTGTGTTAGTGKKKKFGALRKMFKLND